MLTKARSVRCVFVVVFGSVQESKRVENVVNIYNFCFLSFDIDYQLIQVFMQFFVVY